MLLEIIINSARNDKDGGTPLLDKNTTENKIPKIILELKNLFIK
jgi:hypothetical protein